MDISIDLSFEKDFILNVISYVFSKNKVKIPKLLMEIMNESSCSKVYLFPSEVHHAVDVIMKAQEKVFKFLTKECIDFYYKRRISSEKVLLEFTTFHSRIALLDTVDNPEAATEAYYHMMGSVENAKHGKNFTLNREKLILESKKIVGHALEKYVMYLLEEGDRMHREATAIISDSPREAYLVTPFEKVKTIIEIGHKASGSEFLDKEKTVEKDEKIGAEGNSKTQMMRNPEAKSSKSEKVFADSVKDSEFVDVELNEAKCAPISPEEEGVVVKGLAEIVATGDLETVVSRRDENDLVKELLEAMEDIDL